MTIHLSAQLLRSTVHIRRQSKKEKEKKNYLDMSIDTFFLTEAYFQIPIEVVNH